MYDTIVSVNDVAITNETTKKFIKMYDGELIKSPRGNIFFHVKPLKYTALIQCKENKRSFPQRPRKMITNKDIKKDTIDFINNHCVMEYTPDGVLRISDIYAKYEETCMKNGLTPMSKNIFGKAFTDFAFYREILPGLMTATTSHMVKVQGLDKKIKYMAHTYLNLKLK